MTGGNLTPKYIWLGTQKPDLNEERRKLISFLIYGYGVVKASQQLGYCDSWGSQQMREIQKAFNCRQTYQVFYELGRRGFEPMSKQELFQEK